MVHRRAANDRALDKARQSTVFVWGQLVTVMENMWPFESGIRPKQDKICIVSFRNCAFTIMKTGHMRGTRREPLHNLFERIAAACFGPHGG